MLVRDESLNVMMSYYLIERLKQTPNIVVQTSAEVAECRGARRLESLVLQHTKTKDRRTVAAQSLFILIGALPIPIGSATLSYATNMASSCPDQIWYATVIRRLPGPSPEIPTCSRPVYQAFLSQAMRGAEKQ